MNIDKAEIKIATAHDIGVRMDDALEAAKSDIARDDGARAAAVKISAGLEALLAGFQKSLEEKPMDLEAAKVCSEWLQRAIGVARAMATEAAQQKLMSQGRVQAFEQVVANVHKFKTDEETRVRTVIEAARRMEIEPAEASRPPPSLKTQRQAQKKAVRRAKNT